MPALELQPVIVLHFVDGSGSEAERELFIKKGTSKATAITTAVALASLFAAASGCSVVAAEVQYRVKLTGDNPDPGYDVRWAGLLVFEVAAPDEYAIVEVPGLNTGLVLPDGSGQLDPAAPALAALVTALQAAPWCNPWGAPLGDLVAALYQYRR